MPQERDVQGSAEGLPRRATRRTTSTKAPWALKCADCHIERDWKTTAGRFDHDRTKFKLRNAHAARRSSARPATKICAASATRPMDCYSCHKKDDKHEGEQGKQVRTVPQRPDWKVERFDHSLTRFPLTGLHVKAPCKSCHETRVTRKRRATAIPATRRRIGTSSSSAWRARAVTTRAPGRSGTSTMPSGPSYPLEGAHRKVACESCHKQPAPAGRAAAPTGGKLAFRATVPMTCMTGSLAPAVNNVTSRRPGKN